MSIHVSFWALKYLDELRFENEVYRSQNMQKMKSCSS